MFFESCLYPFSIALLAVLWLLISNHSLLCMCPAKTSNEHCDTSGNGMKFSIASLISFAAFIPALFIYASFLSPKGAGDSGVIWLVASLVDSYMLCKCKQPKRWGFTISILVTLALVAGGAYGIWQGNAVHATM